MKNYFYFTTCVVYILLLSVIIINTTNDTENKIDILSTELLGCGQSKMERDAEYYHNYGMNYEQYQNFMKAEKQQWIKDYVQSPVYFPQKKDKK